MALLEWNNSFSTNIKEMDAQHKKLVSMINELHDAMKTGQGKKVTEKILNGLITYVKTHFSAEEELMKKYEYAGFTEQKAEHEKLTKEVLDFQLKFQQDAVAINIEIMKFLKDWLTNHILISDKKYGPFLNSKGVL